MWSFEALLKELSKKKLVTGSRAKDGRLEADGWYAFIGGIHHKIGMEFLDSFNAASVRLQHRAIGGPYARRRGRGGDASTMRFRTRQCVRHALLVLCVALFAWHPAQAARRRDVERKGAIRPAGANFAIADFDGDSLPDFATVQPGPAMASRTNYWIHFKLSLGNQQSFAVSAPTGGLQIASRDVNGDSFLDLIISTRISNEPVAVLLNDGRGNFRLADTLAFGVAIWEARQEWRPGALRCRDAEGALASSGWTAEICDAAVRAELPPATDMLGVSAENLQYSVLPHEFRGRAPPAA
jgi:hypothetical protein